MIDNRCALGEGAWWRQRHARQESTHQGQPASAGWALRRREIAATWRVYSIDLNTLTELFRYAAPLPAGNSREEQKLMGHDKAPAGKHARLNSP